MASKLSNTTYEKYLSKGNRFPLVRLRKDQNVVNTSTSKSIKYREVYALGRHISMSAHKARRVLDQIRGRSYEETLMILELMPFRACYPILKLVYSAAANARHNMGLNETALIISQAEVNEGTVVKKLKPRARGRSFAIRRPTCHITIVLQDTSKDIVEALWDKK
ncbi:hypothetical protein GCM10007933_42940 [Zoogloea oryzae]|uniref:Large ribosomal subunit protein uL22 n=2 Tax=cellular organisms TaxID=131567 RepID=A0ABQ6FJE7_9RHOO|nr:hypothetical protein GCM10007933_42940 [Zoogloea oryzae]